MHADRRCAELRGFQENDPFILVMIDGDGAIFRDQYLAAASSGGGADAAYALLKEIKQQLQDRFEGASQCQVMVHIYANLEGLSKKLASVGLIPNTQDLYNFAKAFTLNQPLFSFIDVGYGKERADHKIRGTLYFQSPSALHRFRRL